MFKLFMFKLICIDIIRYFGRFIRSFIFCILICLSLYEGSCFVDGVFLFKDCLMFVVI